MIKNLFFMLVFIALSQSLCAQSPAIAYNATGDLIIRPASSSAANDYDFLEGKWKVANRKLKTRLNGCTEWEKFASTLEMTKILRGNANREQYIAKINGKPYEAIAIRLFDINTRLWTDFWVDSNNCIMDSHPTTGSFEKLIGRFYASDTYGGKNITVVYQWDKTDPDHPVWSQAYSQDGGKTWEWNWYMTLTRVKV